MYFIQVHHLGDCKRNPVGTSFDFFSFLIGFFWLWQTPRLLEHGMEATDILMEWIMEAIGIQNQLDFGELEWINPGEYLI